MKPVVFVNNYYKLARAKHNRKFFVFAEGHIMEVFNWCDDDVKHQVPDGVVFTPEEIDYVLYRMMDNHDANIGINWEVIDCYVEEIMEAREKGETL